MRVLGIVLTLIGALFFAGFLMMYFSASHTPGVLLRMRVCLLTALAIGVPGIAILVTKFIRTRRYDHNGPAEVNQRLALARSRCISKEHFESLMADAIEEAIKKKKANELPEFLRRKPAN